MSRLIDAEPLEEKLPTRSAAVVHLAPTVDAVEVVRCRDCKWAGRDEHCPAIEVYMICGDNGYCSCGKRKNFFDEFNESHTPEEEHRVMAAAELFGNEVK